MKNALMDIGDKFMLRKRAVIESVNNLLKNKCQVEHTRHRSVVNFLVNLLAAVAAFFPENRQSTEDPLCPFLLPNRRTRVT